MLRVLLIAICLLAVSCSSTSKDRTTTYIPTDLDDAHRELEKLLPKSEIRHIKAMNTEDKMIEYHMSFGMWLRNNWGLWKGSRLASYFNQLGIRYPDDMSGIILDTFWCKLHNKPYRLDARIVILG
jgi:hypothetical protein